MPEISPCNLRPQMSLLFFCPPLANQTSPAGENPTRPVRVGLGGRFQVFRGASVFQLLRPFAIAALIFKTRSSTPEWAVCVSRCFLT